MLPKLHPELNFPDDVSLWNSDQCLQYMAQYGCDLIGNLIVGDSAFKLYLQRFAKTSIEIKDPERKKRYPEKAVNLLAYGDPGSSAGGEQAKFLTTIGPPARQVLVKFSPPLTDQIGIRRGDLLISEHIAHQILSRFGMSASKSEIVVTRDRIFLQIDRFDRMPPRGRRGVISLSSLAAEFCESSASWTSVARELFKMGIIGREALNEVRALQLFGNLIANTDMHLGNLSFYCSELELKGLTPAYDMLPMLYAPQSEQIVEREFKPPIPSPADEDIWNTCWRAACEFWSKVAKDKRISENFKEIAKVNLKELRALSQLFGLLPHSKKK